MDGRTTDKKWSLKLEKVERVENKNNKITKLEKWEKFIQEGQDGSVTLTWLSDKFESIGTSMWKYFKIHLLVKEEVFLFLALAAIFSSARNGLSNFGRGSPKEYSCEIILKWASGLGGDVVLSCFFHF